MESALLQSAGLTVLLVVVATTSALGQPQAPPQVDLRFDWGPGVSPAHRSEIENLTTLTIPGFQARFGQSARTLTIYATSNDQEWDAACTDYMGHPGCSKRASAWPEAIFIPIDLDDWRPEWRQSTMLHEYAHVLQYQNAGIARGAASVDMGPRWLVEGGAEIARYLVEHHLGLQCYEDVRPWLKTAAESQSNPPRLEEITSPDDYYSRPFAEHTARLAVDFLMTRYGNSVQLDPRAYASLTDPIEFSNAFETQRQAGFPYIEETTVAACAMNNPPTASQTSTSGDSTTGDSTSGNPRTSWDSPHTPPSTEANPSLPVPAPSASMVLGLLLAMSFYLRRTKSS